MAKKSLFWLLPLCTVLAACPYESTVPLEPHPVEAVDSSLVGYWYGIVKDGSDFFGIEALEITPKSDSLYDIIRYGKAIKGDIVLPDTSYFTGFTSWVNEQRFMNLEGWVTLEMIEKKKRVTKKQKVFYASAFHLSNDTLDVKTVTESFTTRKYFSRPVEFKELLSDMMTHQNNIYDDQYSLKYRKIPKPEHIFTSQ